MKCILMICDFLNESLSYQENLLAKYYDKLGHRIVVVTSTTEDVFEFIQNRHDPARPATCHDTGNLRVYRQPYAFSVLGRIRKFRGVDAILDKERPDLIVVHDIQFNFDAVRRYKQQHAKTRVVMDYHADYFNSGRSLASRWVLHRLLRRPVLRRALPMLDDIYPVTPASQQFLHEMYDVPQERMQLLPLGCDMDLCRTVLAGDEALTLRQRYGISREAPVIFGGGKLAPPKQIERLIGAFQSLKHPTAWLAIAGDAGPEDKPYLAQLQAQARHTPRILFTGWLQQRQMLAHLQMSDLAVFPASQSILWQQAIGMGKPLIIGEPQAVAGGHQDITYLNCHDNIMLALDDGPVHGSAALAQAIAQLLTDVDRRQRMSAGAHRTAAAMLDWNLIARRTLGPTA